MRLGVLGQGREVPLEVEPLASQYCAPPGLPFPLLLPRPPFYVSPASANLSPPALSSLGGHRPLLPDTSHVLPPILALPGVTLRPTRAHAWNMATHLGTAAPYIWPLVSNHLPLSPARALSSLRLLRPLLTFIIYSPHGT